MEVVNKPWGQETWLELNDKYCYKKIFFKEGHQCSLQYHEHKKETIHVVSGTGYLYIEPDDNIKADTKTEKGVGDGFEEYGEPPVDDPDAPDIVPVKEPEPETFVDEEAEFPGGYPAMMAFIQKNLVFPETAIENGVQGKCFLRFVVSVNGTISSVQVTKGVPDCPDCDKAAIKAIRSMPNWKPGKLNGRSVSSYCSIPINFAIE